jgi:hypothetical protein
MLNILVLTKEHKYCRPTPHNDTKHMNGTFVSMNISKFPRQSNTALYKYVISRCSHTDEIWFNINKILSYLGYVSESQWQKITTDGSRFYIKPRYIRIV